MEVAIIYGSVILLSVATFLWGNRTHIHPAVELPVISVKESEDKFPGNKFIPVGRLNYVYIDTNMITGIDFHNNLGFNSDEVEAEYYRELTKKAMGLNPHMSPEDALVTYARFKVRISTSWVILSKYNYDFRVLAEFTFSKVTWMVHKSISVKISGEIYFVYVGICPAYVKQEIIYENIHKIMK